MMCASRSSDSEHDSIRSDSDVYRLSSQLPRYRRRSIHSGSVKNLLAVLPSIEIGSGSASIDSTELNDRSPFQAAFGSCGAGPETRR